VDLFALIDDFKVTCSIEGSRRTIENVFQLNN
jgi:hypothetical protein